jgi:hypothetical protein
MVMVLDRWQPGVSNGLQIQVVPSLFLPIKSSTIPGKSPVVSDNAHCRRRLPLHIDF